MGTAPERRAELVALGNAVRAARVTRGLSQEELAAAAEISSRYLSKVEQGQANPTIEVLLAVAEALGRTASALMLIAEADTTE